MGRDEIEFLKITRVILRRIIRRKCVGIIAVKYNLPSVRTPVR